MFLLFVGAPLIELFYRANIRLLLWLNGYFAAHPALYKAALFLGDRGSDFLVLATLALLWFWPRNAHSRDLFGDATLTRNKQKRVWLRDMWAGLAENVNAPIVTRDQSRAQVLVFALGGILAYVLVRLLAFEIGINRPFATYWPVSAPAGMQSVFDGLRRSHSFPADHAAILGGLAAALFFWNRRLGWLLTAAAIIMSLCRVAVGFHYPLDMIVGAVVGVICVWLLLNAYHQREALYRGANELARAFDLSNTPYCYLLYFLLLMGGLEALMHFEHLLAFVFSARGAIVQSLQSLG